MSLHYFVKHEWPKTNEIHHVPKNQADAFFVLAFKAVDLVLTEHCGNNHHLLLPLHWRASKCWNSGWSHHWMGEGRAISKQTMTVNIFLHFVNSILYPIVLTIWRSSYGKQFFISEKNQIYLFMHRLNWFFWTRWISLVFRSFMFHKVV